MKHTVPKQGFRLSNFALLVVIGVLSLGVLLDGTLYNKAPAHAAIHSIVEAKSIQIDIKDQMLLRLEKNSGAWIQTHPVTAPAQTMRVQALLDTNKYNQRSYAISELPKADIFSDEITLKIDDVEFQFGAIEPVSSLRYVRSDDRVYLQPDTVLPMLNAVDTVFTDLRITNKVKRIIIDETDIEQPEAWSDLMAIGIVDIGVANSEGQSIEITLTEKNQTRVLTAAHSDFGYTITSDKNFTYLLSSESAKTLGLSDLLPTLD